MTSRSGWNRSAVKMSKSSSMLSNGKGNKGQDDSHLKILRELTHIAGNRHCFDCGQRGPTYVNVTIGSFVCMTCSGLLRGLTPPHRVKSISMASFSPEEIELFKSRGNDYCRKVWLATCTSRDANLGSEKDPDRQNTLRSFMSAKYEQKRYYVDPSKLPQSELTEIQAQTAKALSSSSSSISNSSSTMQKSPSLSSASSASSLSLHNNNQNNPSPILNNSRNNSSQMHMNSQNRLVNSITLPDIKPLSSLLGPVNLASNTGNQMNGSKSNNLVAGGSLGLSNGKQTSTPVPINFINNLSSVSSSSSQLQNGSSVMPGNDPWGDSSDNNNFNANFADFDAFNSNSDSKSNGVGGISGGGTNGFSDLGTTGMGNFANFDAFQHQPLLPANNGNSTGGVMDLHSASNLPPPVSSARGTAEDKYAALKDLDSIFKQGFNEEPTGNGVGGSHGISSSASFPANLSSSGTSGLAGGWFSSSPNQQQGVNSSSGVTNGWTVNGANGPNPHNPFFNNASAWQSPPPATPSVSNSLFSASPAVSTSCFQQASGMPGGDMASSPALSNGFGNPAGVINGTTNGLFSSNGSNGLFSSATQQPFHPASSSSFSKAANPFFSAMPTPAVNPNNPFL